MKNLDFAKQSVPHSWYQVADEFYEQSNKIWQGHGNAYLTTKDRNGNVISILDSANRCAFLIGGFALENIIKAYLVYENPTWISNGSLSKQLKSHDLLLLASKSKEAPTSSKVTYILKNFSSGLESWARYPCGLSYDRNPELRHINVKLWADYQQVFKQYESKLLEMMSKNWKGPHGIEGRYEFK